jgi:hypothetical protein
MNQIEKLPLRELIAQINLAQIWGLLGVLSVLLGAAYTIGHTVAESKAQRVVTSVQSKLVELGDNLSQLSEDRSLVDLKVHFLDHYLRYCQAKQANEKERKIAKKLFVDFLHEMWITQESSAIIETTEHKQSFNVERAFSVGKSDVPGVEPEERTRIRKTVKFRGDSRVYEIPMEISEAVHLRNN